MGVVGAKAVWLCWYPVLSGKDAKTRSRVCGEDLRRLHALLNFCGLPDTSRGVGMCV